VSTRIGMGFDAHTLTEGCPLILGGVEIPYNMRLVGHSDGDVLTHAIIDALLGASGIGDKGVHFPSSDPTYLNASSLKLLSQTSQMVHNKGWRVINVDATIIAQRPYLRPFIESMKTKIGEVLNTSTETVSIKATTTDHMGFIGREEGMVAQAVVLLEKHK